METSGFTCTRKMVHFQPILMEAEVLIPGGGREEVKAGEVKAEEVALEAKEKIPTLMKKEKIRAKKILMKTKMMN